MNSQQPSSQIPGMSVKGMLLGGLIGGLVGAVLRGGFTLMNLREAGEFGLVASLPSTGIGFLCGAVAGCCCRWKMGAVLGAVLSAGVFGLFMIPVTWLMSLFDAAQSVREWSWPYFLQKAIAGAVAGGVGGYVGSRAVRSDNLPTLDANPPANTTIEAADRSAPTENSIVP